MMEPQFHQRIPQRMLNIIMTFVLLSSLANYMELHHDEVLRTTKEEKAASHLSNTHSMGYFEELPLCGQCKQEEFWRDYVVS